MKFFLTHDLLKKRIVCMAGIALIVVFFGMIIMHFTKQDLSHQKNEQEQLVFQQLNRIENHLATVNQSLQNTHSSSSEQFTHLSNQLNSIQQSISQLNSDERVQQLKTVFSETNQAVIDKLQNLQQTLQQLKKQMTPRQFLSAKALPFKVTSVDIWNGEPQATITIDGSSMLLAKEDTQSGWMLTDISFEPALVIFKNTKQQFVKITF